MKNKLAILVLSCDKYASLWPLFFDRFKRFWPDCEYPIFLLANEFNFQRDGVETIKIGPDKDWTSNLMRALEFVDAENVLLMLDDAPLAAKVDSDKFSDLISIFESRKFNYLNCKASPLPKNKTEFNSIGELPPGSNYRAALVPCIWRVSILKDIAKIGESAWQFEIRGSKRSDQHDRFFSLWSPFFQITHIIIKGKIDRRAHSELMKNNELDGMNFQLMSKTEYIMLRIQESRSFFINLFPYNLRRNLRDFYFKTIKNRKDWI
jgi:hypothetical protein